MSTPASALIRVIDAAPSNSGVNCSLALDGNQIPLISCWRDPETPDPALLLITAGSSLLSEGATPFSPETVTSGCGTGSALAVQTLSRPSLGGGSTVFSVPWIAYYDIERRSVNAAHRSDTGWMIDVIETGLDHFAPAGIGIAIGTDDKPRVSYATSKGVTVATWSPATMRKPGNVPGDGPNCWQRDTLAGLHWQRSIIEVGRLTAGYDAGVAPDPPPAASGQVPTIALSEEPDSLKLVYRGQTASSFGAVFVTFGKDISNLEARKKADLADVTAYSSLTVELRGDQNRRVQVGIKDRTQPDNGSEVKVTLTLNADWTRYTIPLEKFTKVDLSQVYFVTEFVFAGAEPVTMFVRSAKFSDVAVADIEINRVEPPARAAPIQREFLKGLGPVPGFEEPPIGTSPPLSGAAGRFLSGDQRSSAMKIAFPAGRNSAFVILRPRAAASVDVSQFSTLIIEMRGDPPFVPVLVGVKDLSRRDRDDVVRIPITPTADWRTYAIPLSLFRQGAGVPNLSQMFAVAEFVNKTSSALAVFVRNVRYSSAPATTIAPFEGAATLGSSVAIHTSLALDAANRPYVSYFDLETKRLNVACRAEQFAVGSGGTLNPVRRWQVVSIDPRSDEFAGEFTAIQVDDEGGVHVAYWTLNGPRYARIRSAHGSVLVEAIDTTAGAGMYISLALRSVNNVHEPVVAYYDPSPGGRLKIARRTGDRWTPAEVVDAGGNVGGFASLRLARNGSPLIAYYDFDQRRPRIASMAPRP